MRDPVIIKGNHYGLSVFLDPELPMEQLLEALASKFREASRFFRGASLALSFEGRALTQEETNAAVNTICDNSEIHISCVIDTDKAREAFFRRVLEEQEEKESGSHKEPEGQFCKGTLRSGQVLEAEGSVILLGDVNPGARIAAKGNIIVLGALRGTALAGLAGEKHAVIVALEMEPVQLRIGGAALRPGGRFKASGPQIAYLDFGQLRVEPLCKEILDEVHLD